MKIVLLSLLRPLLSQRLLQLVLLIVPVRTRWIRVPVDASNAVGMTPCHRQRRDPALLHLLVVLVHLIDCVRAAGDGGHRVRK